MIGWIYRLIVGSFSSCHHDFKIIKEGEEKDIKSGSVIGYVYVLQCSKCGELKNHKVKP